jgi:starch synthase
MKVMYVSSEVVPFAKTGGLADVAGSLAPELQERGADVSLFMPFYSAARRAVHDFEDTGARFQVTMGNDVVNGAVYETRLPETKVPVFLLDAPELYGREELYTSDGVPYPDNAMRFIFFSRAVLEFIIARGLNIDVIHVNDWQSALVPVYLKTLYADRAELSGMRSILTIHNLSYQGLFWHFDMDLTGLDWLLFHWKRLEFYGKINFLKGGIVYADAITTVSKRYAREIQTEEFGCGLEGVFSDRADDLTGILNGVDYTEWNPETDKFIAANYSAGDLGGKVICKADLQRRLGLAEDADIPLLGMVTRLVEQKGVDLVADIFPKLMAMGVQLVILGSGEENYELQLRELAEEYPKQAAAIIAYDNALAHQIEAGADFFLMPSRFEPCGLNQMYSLKYGTIPIVRNTGGLADTVVHATPANLGRGRANGFVFNKATPNALLGCIKNAVQMFRENRTAYDGLQAGGMKQDFSWSRSAESYMKLYRKTGRQEIEPV